MNNQTGKTKKIIIYIILLIVIFSIIIFLLYNKKIIKKDIDGPEVKGLLYIDPLSKKLVLYEKWEEPFNSITHTVTNRQNLEIKPFLNWIVKTKVEYGDTEIDEIIPLEFEKIPVTSLSTLEKAKWIRLIILNDLDRQLGITQAINFIKENPKSEYTPNIYNYLAQVYIYNKEFQKAADTYRDYIDKYPQDQYNIEKFRKFIDRITRRYLTHPAYGKFIYSREEWLNAKREKIKNNLPNLINALKEVEDQPDKLQDRYDIIKVILKSGDTEAVDFILDYEKEAPVPDKFALTKFLQKDLQIKGVREYYISLLGSEIKDLKVQSIQALRNVKDSEEVVDKLIKLLDSKDEDVVSAAIISLGKIGNPQAKPFLLKLKDTKNETIKESLDYALKKLE